MFHRKNRGPLCVIIAGTVMMFDLQCGNITPDAAFTETGSIEMQVQLLSNMRKIRETEKTVFDSLVIEISAGDMAPLRYCRFVDPGKIFTIDTLSGIPVGAGRTVKVMTINAAGEVIHVDSTGDHTVKIEPNVLTVLSVALIPVKGSLFVQLAEIPSSVDSVVASFTDNFGKIYHTSVARSPKVYLSIDGIPLHSNGTLMVAGISNAGDTIFIASKECTVEVWPSAIQLSFEGTPGGLVFTGTLVLPGATLVSGSMGKTPVAQNERGDLLITEIMYAANDSEYIEVFNPGKQTVTFDSLIMDIDGARRLFTDVVIDAGQYFVFGRSLLPWVNISHSVQSALDLSAKGNWITIIAKDGTIIDQVIFAGGSNDLEWPRVTGKQSICLNTDSYEGVANNFGRNWTASLQEIEGTTSQMGTPQKR